MTPARRAASTSESWSVALPRLRMCSGSVPAFRSSMHRSSSLRRTHRSPASSTIDPRYEPPGANPSWVACGPGTESGCSASQSDPSGWSPMPGDDVVAAGNGAGGPPSAAAPGPAVDKAAPAANRRSASAWVSPSAAAISPTPNSSSPSAATRVCAPVPSVARRPAEPCAVMRRSPVAGWRPASIEAKSLRPTGPSRPSVRAVRPSQRPGSSALSA